MRLFRLMDVCRLSATQPFVLPPCRVMAAAGCPVTVKLPGGEASTLDTWLACLERLGPAWAKRPGMDHITTALLQCGAAEPDPGRPQVLSAAMAAGSRPVFVGLRSALINPAVGAGLVQLAAQELGRLLARLPAPPPQVSLLPLLRHAGAY